jgi:hypothetical protein
MVLFSGIAEEAKVVAAGNEKTFEDRRNAAIAECKKLGITQGMIYRTLERNGLEAITTDDLIYLHGLLTSISDGTVTVFDAFGPQEKAAVRAEVPKPKSTRTVDVKTEKQPPPAPETKTPEPETKPEPPSQAPAASETAPPPEPKPEPPPPPAKIQKPKAPPPAPRPEPQSPVAAIRSNLAEAKLTEAQLISWLNDIGTVPDGTTTLEEVNAKWLKMVLDDWNGILAQVTDFLKSAASSFP